MNIHSSSTEVLIVDLKILGFESEPENILEALNVDPKICWGMKRYHEMYAHMHLSQ